ncbi:MAG: hypothetical protein JJU33_10995 [Phycisphaerales bacterium]|nr:hypothetical protein [Phycisphaerales bacterium]
MQRKTIIMAGAVAFAIAVGAACVYYLLSTRSTVVSETGETAYESAQFTAQLDSGFALRTGRHSRSELEGMLVDAFGGALADASARPNQPIAEAIADLGGEYASVFFHADFEAWFELAAGFDPEVSDRLDEQRRGTWASAMEAYKDARIDLDKISVRFVEDIDEFPEAEPLTFIVSGDLGNSYGAQYRSDGDRSSSGYEFLIPMLYHDVDANELVPATLGLRFSAEPGGEVRPVRSYIYLTEAGMGRGIRPPVGF